MSTYTVIRAFGAYNVGDEITDDNLISAILLGPRFRNIRYKDDGGSSGVTTVFPLYPGNVTPVSGAPDPILAVTYGYALDLTSLPATLYHWTGTAWAIAIQAGSGGTTPAVPTNTALPAITGTAQVGQTLAASQGTWTGAPTSYAYQWLRNGVAIPSATAATYAPVVADVGAVLTCAVTATNAAGASQAAVSAGTSAVIAATPILQALGLTSLVAVAGTPFSAALTGRTAGSAVATTSSDGTVLTVASGQVSGTFTATGSPTVTLTETLAGATGSPKITTLTMTVAATAPDTTITTDLSNPDRGLNPLI